MKAEEAKLPREAEGPVELEACVDMDAAVRLEEPESWSLELPDLRLARSGGTMMAFPRS